MSDTTSLLDLLLAGTVPNVAVNRQKASVEIPRLSNQLGAPAIFEVQSITFSQLATVREISSNDFAVNMALAGIVAPDLKDATLQGKYNATTKAELLTALLLPGEIEALRRETEQLSGFGELNAVAVKNG